MSKPKKENYAVGYARPPVSTQFQPGKSGNPKGRPKGARNFAVMIEAELMELVTITENGKTRKLSKLAIIVKRLINNAAQGDAKAIATLLQYDRQTEAKAQAVAAASEEASKHDQMVMQNFLERIRQSTPAQETDHDEP
jgi:hypothetical protein